jgi:AraC-like DNA-binding protein
MMHESARLDSSVVSPGKWVLLPRGGIFLLKASDRSVTLEVERGTYSRVLRLDRHRSALVANRHHVQAISRDGAWYFESIPIYETSKLLAFLDSGATSRSARCGLRVGCEGCLVADVPGDVSVETFERWLVTSFAKRVISVETLLDFVRAGESYKLVRFLLAERLQFRTIDELAVRYGLSESHFRRLCRQAFGGSLKREIRRWRAAAGAMAFLEERRNMTDIAINNGFANASHFSREVKNFFGISLGRVRRRKSEV